MDPALQELFAEGVAEDEVAVIVRIVEGAPLPLGIRLVAQFGRIWTCRLRRGDIPRIRADQAVHSMKAAHLYGAMPAAPDSADGDVVTPSEFRFAEPGSPPQNGMPQEELETMPGDERRSQALTTTGAGTVVAHIDWGVDFAHPDFRHADGRTRLLALWDQSQPMDPTRPNPYGYGRIHMRHDIDRALASPDPYAALDYYPADSDTGAGSHGTHTLAISCGNGRSGGPCGLAPDADIVFVHLSTYTPDGPTGLGDSVALCEGCHMIGVAAQLRPVSINASIGRHAGQHDGRTLTEQAMDAFLLERPGRSIVLSAGNYYKRGSHAQGLLRPGESAVLHLVADAQRRTPTEVDLWYPGTDRMRISLAGPDGCAPVTAEPGQRASIVMDGREIGRLYHRVDDPNNGDCQATLLLYAAAPAASWELSLYGTDVTDGRYHAWVERNTISAHCQAHFLDADSEATGSTGTICNGLRTIAVGAYNAHRQERPLANFSSCGPTRDGRQKPDLVAPGVRVLAARSTPRGTPAGSGLQTRMSGTSMAAPHVAGTVALMFEAAGRPLSIDETRRILLGVAEELPAGAPHLLRLRTGSGFLDSAAAVAGARELALTPPTNRESIMSQDHSSTSPGSDDGAEASSERARKHAYQQAAPFQIQMPIGGGTPALAMPLGGAGSPFAFTVPLGGSAPAAAPAPALLPASSAAPAPGPTGMPAATAPTPALVAPDPNDPVATLSTNVQFYMPSEPGNEWAEWAPPGARPMLRRGARGPAVQEAQHKLNQVHASRQASGQGSLDGAPLAEDGVFGAQTGRAVVSFQQLVFPGQPTEADGVIGPKTWAMLDARSRGPIIVPPLPAPVVPPFIPVADAGCGNLTVWINAFIPANVSGYTIPVPSGPHAGKTAIPCPLVATPVNPMCPWRGYLTDQRSFDPHPGASVRMRSLAEIQLVAPRLVRQVHETSGTVEVSTRDGAQTCRQNADMSRCGFFNFRVAPMISPAGAFRITLDYVGSARDPCVNLAADIDYAGAIEILCVPSSSFLEVRVNGLVDAFPAFEMYASLAGTTRELFRLAPPAGNTVADLLGGAGTPVGGRAQFNCSFAQGEQPQPGTAFTAFRAGAERTAFEARAEAEVEAAATLAMDREQAWRGSVNAEFAAANGNMLLAAAALASMPSGSVTHGSALSGPAVADAECGCGAQRVARADTMALSVAAGAHSAAELVEAMLEGEREGEPGEAMDEADSATLVRLPALAPTLLFKLLSGPAIGGATPQLRDAAARFDVVARPGERLGGINPRAGDLLVRVARGEGWGNVAVVASHGLPSLDRLEPLGLRPEGGTRQHPGRYLHVIEITPRRVPAAAGLARRLADSDNVVLADTLLLRPRTAPASDTESPAVACCAGARAGTGTGGSEAFESAEQVTGPSCDTLSQFAHDSDALLPVHMAQINAAALNILIRGVRSVAVTGFASSDGSNAYNQALGMRRAEHVAGELRTVLERMRHGAGSSISITVASRGEEDQIASGAVTLNRRVTICPSAPPRPQVQPPAVRQKILHMTAKSFIGRIGAHTGTLSCGLNTRLGHIPSPTTNPALRAFAALTDAGFSENPLTDGIFVTAPPDNKGYRLFSSARIQVEHRGTALLSASVVGALLTDAGKECVPGVSVCLQAPPLRVDMAPTFTRIDASRVRVTWGVRGRPPSVTEPAFTTICDRTCVFIWHRVKATIDCSSGVPVVTSLTVEGSRFPSHRLWLDGAMMHDVPQGPLSALWSEEPGDPTRVH